jgi:hypothetical protein
MPAAIKPPKTFLVARREPRIPIEVGVSLTGPSRSSPRESTFTRDISARGAKVLSARRWRKNQRLTLTALAGDFQSGARVAYCKWVPGSGFTVGLELLEPDGKWIVGREDTN